MFSSSGSPLGQFGGVISEDGGLGPAIASLAFIPCQKGDPENV